MNYYRLKEHLHLAGFIRALAAIPISNTRRPGTRRLPAGSGAELKPLGPAGLKPGAKPVVCTGGRPVRALEGGD